MFTRRKTFKGERLIQKNQKQVDIEGGITFQEAKKIALDYHIKHGGLKMILRAA